jgi:hypothetical protein
MSLQRIIPWLVAALLLSVAGMTIAASARQPLLAGVFSGAFAAAMVVISLATNLPYWRAGEAAVTQGMATRRNMRLIALTCTWAALAMQSMYTPALTSLWWQHGWQYALGFALLAVGAFSLAHLAGRGDAVSRQRLERYMAPIAASQAVGSACGLVFLVGAGKLGSTRPDWAANWVFLFAALALMVLGAVTLHTHVRVARGSDGVTGS